MQGWAGFGPGPGFCISSSMFRGYFLFTAPLTLQPHPENNWIFKRLQLFVPQAESDC